MLLGTLFAVNSATFVLDVVVRILVAEVIEVVVVLAEVIELVVVVVVVVVGMRIVKDT